MNKNAKTILSIVAVAAAGVALGMLLAPGKTADLKSSVKGSIDDIGDKVDDLIDTGKEKLMDASDELKTRTNKIKREMKNGVNHFGRV